MSEDDDLELKRLRMQKMQALLKAKEDAARKSQSTTLTLADKMDRLLDVLLTADALSYLNQIKSRNITTYNKIRQALFPPKLMSEINLLMQYLNQGMIRRGVIPLVEVQYLERQALGIGSKITIKRQGQDAQALNDFLKDDD